MAESLCRNGIGRFPTALCIVVLCCGGLVVAPVLAQTQLSLADINRRQGPESRPVYSGRSVTLQGIVNSPAIRFPEQTLLAIQDSSAGAILCVAANSSLLDSYGPGDQLQIVGTVSQRLGIPVVVPDSILLVARKPAPAPVTVSPRDLEGFRYLGMLVRTVARVENVAQTLSGESMRLRGINGLWVFLPEEHESDAGAFDGYEPGDLVEATGVSSQYSPRAPFDHGFELLLPDAAHLIRKQRALGAPMIVLGVGLLVALGIGFFMWGRERRLRGQRLRLRKTFQIGEEILGASSAESIWTRLEETLPAILGITRVHLYLYNRAGKTLDQVAEPGSEPITIPLASPPPGPESGAAACFHYGLLLPIPDPSHTPFPIATSERKTPRSLLFVPMMAQAEVVGVMELDQDDRQREFSAEEQALAQHLANQIAAAMRLMAQRTVQAQLFRTEKMAAVGRLISGVVNELQTPLESISELSKLALERETMDGVQRDLKAIGNESQKASGIVARLVSYAAAESEAKPVSISALLRSLIEFRENEWKASGIKLAESISPEPLLVSGSQGQLEQVFLNLLVHSEQALAEAPRKLLSIRTSILAKRLLVEISFSAPPEASKPEEAASVLGVTRSVVAGHGGEVRLLEKPNADPRFEVELPLALRERTGAPAAAAVSGTQPARGRGLTALVIEPEENAQRQLIALLSARAFRVVPLASADNGLDISQRMRFDAAFCSVHAPGLNWVELSERMHSRVGGFVLLSEGYDSELAADFEGDGRFVLPKPIQEADLDRILRAIEAASAPQSGKVINIRDIA